MTLPSDTSETNNVQNEKEKMSRTPWPLVVTVICTMCGQVATGICGGALNSPEDFIKHFMNETSVSRGQGPLSDDRLASYYALLSALVPLGSVIGSPLTQYTADAIGRKLLLLVSAVLGMVSALVMGLSVEFRSPEMLFAGRVMAGVMCGVAGSLPPFYMAEILPRHLIGPVMVGNMLFLLSGVVINGILSFDDILATPDLWPAITAVFGVVCVVQLLLLPWVVQSPSFLLFVKNKEDAALEALQKLRGTKNVQLELSKMKAFAAHRKKQVTVLQLLTTRSQLRPVILIVGSFVCFFFTGIVILAFYSVSVLTSAGLSLRVARYITPAFTMVGIIESLILVFIVERLKRRVLMLGGLAGMLVAEVVLTIALLYQGQAEWLSTVAIVCSFVLGMFHIAGPAQVPWILLPEMFEAEARGAASSIGVTVMNVSSFVMTYAFPPLQKYCGPYSILLFVGTSTFFFVFFFFLQPETMGSFAKENEETQYTVEGPQERTQL